ncbi:MAG: hydrogenase 3 maturation endopeptidase HyCI [Methanospirillum sp.]|nr:hydrogenase 3 maturation endopeptidase HyCI [Methanospirillum sp.]
MKILLGTGNDLLGDDGVGISIVHRFSKDAWIPIDAGIMPENFIRPIRDKNPELIVIIDAVQMDLAPGTVRQIPSECVRDCGTGSHQLPLTHLISQLGLFCERVILIGIQPGCIEPDTGLTGPVSASVEELLRILYTERFDQVPVWKPPNV